VRLEIGTVLFIRHTQLLSLELMKEIERLWPFVRDLFSLTSHLEKEDGNVSLLKSAQDLAFIINEYIERLHDIRRLLIKVHLQKRELAQHLEI
jgi:hypothetical protein